MVTKLSLDTEMYRKYCTVCPSSSIRVQLPIAETQRERESCITLASLVYYTEECHCLPMPHAAEDGQILSTNYINPHLHYPLDSDILLSTLQCSFVYQHYLSTRSPPIQLHSFNSQFLTCANLEFIDTNVFLLSFFVLTSRFQGWWFTAWCDKRTLVACRWRVQIHLFHNADQRIKTS